MSPPTRYSTSNEGDQRSNPFATRFIRPGTIDFIFPQDMTLEQLLERLSELGYRAQIVGEHGTGKSTLLAAIERSLICNGHRVTRFDQPETRFGFLMWSILARKYASGDTLAIDGFERLDRVRRWLITTAAKLVRSSLIVTCHDPCHLPTLWETRVPPALAKQIVNHLTRNHPRARIAAQTALPACLDKQNGNLREALFDLYDICRPC